MQALADIGPAKLAAGLHADEAKPKRARKGKTQPVLGHHPAVARWAAVSYLLTFLWLCCTECSRFARTTLPLS